MANLLSTSISGTATTSDSVVIGGTFANNAHSSVSSTRLMFGGGNEPNNYSIGTSLNNYGGNYTKLDLRWHTGIRMGAQPNYGGIRFFSDETLTTRIMSIGETDANIRIDNNLYIGGAGGWITDLLGAKQNASTAITTSNIGSQSVSTAGYSDYVAAQTNPVGNFNVGLSRPKGASYTTMASTVTGAIKIKLPPGVPVHGMWKMTVKIYEYGQRGNGYTIELGCHLYPSSAHNRYQWMLTTDTGGVLPIRYGTDGTSGCVWIGENGTTWSYPQIHVTEFSNGYSNPGGVNWNTGTWGVTIGAIDNSVAVDGPFTTSLIVAGSATTAGSSVNFMSTSNAGSYWLVNNWTGTHWQITSNHGAGVRVAYADSVANFSGTSSGTNTGDQTNISGNANTTSQKVFNDLKIDFPSGGSGGYSFGSNHYSMGLDVGNGAWSPPHYKDIIIGYHTGVRIGAHYSGIRFYNNSPTTDANNDGNGDGGESLLMTIGGYVGTANHTDVVVNNNLIANVSLRAPIFYDSQDTAYYVDPNSTSNLSASYIGRVLINYDDTDTWFRMQFGNRMRITTTGGTDFIIPNTGEMSYNGNTVIHTGNIGSQSVSYATTAGNAATATALQTGRTLTVGATGKTFDGTGNVSWTLGEIGAQVAGSYAAASHTHSISDVINLASALNSKLGTSDKAADSELIDGIDSSRIIYGDGARGSTSVSSMDDRDQKSGFFFKDNPTGQPFGDWWNWLTVAGNSWQSSNNYSFQISHAFHSDDAYIRRMTNGTAYGWRTLITSGNIGSQTVATAGNASTLGGNSPNQTGGVNTIVQRDSNGYIQNSYFYTSGGGSERGTGISYIAGFNSSDYYIRSYTLQGLASAMSGVSMNIAGNAATATIFNNGTLYVSTVNGNTLNSGFSDAGDGGDIWINYRGYNDAQSYFRDFRVGNGKGTQIALFTGSTGSLAVTGTISASNLSGTNTGDQTNISGNAATANGANGNFYIDDNYGNSIVGVYTSTRYQGVFAMGDAYKLPADGTGTGNLYGIAWTHTNVGGQSKTGLEHQALFVANGITQTAIGTGIWTSGLITTTSYGTSANWNTAYGWGNHGAAGYATTAYVTTAVNNLVNGAPGVLDTLNELATALASDPNFATTMTTALAGKASTAHDHTFASLTSKPTTIAGYGITDSITTANIGSQSVNYAASAGAVAWTNVSSRPTAVSSFTNDSGFITGGHLSDYTSGALRVIADYDSSSSWWIRSSGQFLWANAHDWSRSFRLNLTYNDTVGTNAKWAEFGQMDSNHANGTYRGVRIRKCVNNNAVDGDISAGGYYVGDTQIINSTGAWIGGTLSGQVTLSNYTNGGLSVDSAGIVKIEPSYQNISLGESYASNLREYYFRNGYTVSPTDTGYKYAKLIQQNLLNEASLVLIPQAIKPGLLGVNTPTNTDMTFTRTGDTATRVNASGLIEPVAANIARIDYTGGGCGKLLLEPQRTNLITYSEQFDNAAWSGGGTTCVANLAVSPDGYTNADLIYPTSSGNFTGKYQAITPSTTGTVSCYVKQAGKRFAQLGTDNNATYTCAFDLQLGTVVRTATNYTATITSAGNGWYRITAAYVSSAAASYPFVGVSDDSAGAVVVDGTNGIYVWGFQYETLASYATSYIPTLSAAVTRGADACYKTGISSLIGQTEGTIFIDFVHDIVPTATNSSRIQLSDGTADNWIFLAFPNGNKKQLRLYINVGGVNQLSVYSTANLLQGRNKAAAGYKSGNLTIYLNGLEVAVSILSVGIPSTSHIDLQGAGPTGVTLERENLFNVMLFKTRLSNAQLAELTAL